MTRPEVISPTDKAKKKPFRIPASPLRSNWKNDFESGELPCPSSAVVRTELDLIPEY